MSRVLLFQLIFVLMASPSFAGGLSEGEVRFITLEGQMTSSDCVGNPVTPICAVETQIACALWDDEHICTTLGPDRPRGESLGPKRIKEEFVIDGVEIIREEDITPEFRNTDWYQVGFADVTVKRRVTFSDGSVWPSDGWDTFSYTYRPAGHFWHYVSMAMWGTDDFAEQ